MQTNIHVRPVRFSRDDAQRSSEAWRFNCGPAAIAAVLEMTPDEVRPHLGSFEQKGYTNPMLMYWILDHLLGEKRWRKAATFEWPWYGLVRIQWHGPWMAPGVPIQARYRKTHWVAARRTVRPFPHSGVPQDAQVRESVQIFDINALCAGGWIDEAEWATGLVPWLVPQFPDLKGWDGNWSRTHCLEVPAPA